MGKTARELTEKEADALAFDVAVGYFEPGQLLRRYSLSEKQLENVLRQEPFLRKVDEQKRQIEDGGETFMLQARTAAAKTLTSIERLAGDRSAPGTARVKAAELIMKAAGYDYMKPQQAQAAQTQPITINTNLALGQQPKGTYTIEARPEREAIEVQPQYVGSDDPGADLL